MNRKTVKWIAILIAALFLLSAVVPLAFQVVSAETVQQKINKANDAKKEAQQKLNSTNAKKEKSLNQLENLEREASNIQGQVNNINAQIAKTDEKLGQKQQMLDEATEKAKQKYSAFKERFRVMCEDGPVSYLEILFSAKNFADFTDKLEIAKEISDYDKDIFDEMEQSRKTIETEKNEIAQLKTSQEANKSKLVAQKNALSAKQQEQQKYISELSADAKSYQKVIDDQERAMDSLKAQLSAQLSKSTSSSGAKGQSGIVIHSSGQFLWPSSCHTVTSQFSPSRKNPVSGVYRKHTGVDIGASYGSAVMAADSGNVTLAGWNSGYGNCVVIDHGSGRATLYGHLSSIGVSRGQSVSKGQTIGAVGSTGNSTGPHLHFEILINGGAVNPLQYF